jgi:hypothetical protein
VMFLHFSIFGVYLLISNLWNVPLCAIQVAVSQILRAVKITGAVKIKKCLHPGYFNGDPTILAWFALIKCQKSFIFVFQEASQIALTLRHTVLFRHEVTSRHYIMMRWAWFAAAWSVIWWLLTNPMFSLHSFVEGFKGKNRQLHFGKKLR